MSATEHAQTDFRATGFTSTQMAVVLFSNVCQLNLFEAFESTGGVGTRGFNIVNHRLEQLLHIDLTKVAVAGSDRAPPIG